MSMFNCSAIRAVAMRCLALIAVGALAIGDAFAQTQASPVTNIATTIIGGQTFITYTEPYTGSSSANIRYLIYRQANTAYCPITASNLSDATQIEIVPNNGAQLNPNSGTVNEFTQDFRQDPTQQMVSLNGSTPLPAFTGLAIYTALANGAACYGVVTHDTSGMLSDSNPVSTSNVDETTGTRQLIVQSIPTVCCSPDGHSGSAFMYYFHPSSSTGTSPVGPGVGYTMAYWGDSTMAWEDGIQQLVDVWYDTVDFNDGSTNLPVIEFRPYDGVWYHPYTNVLVSSTCTAGVDTDGCIQTYWTGLEYNGTVYPWTINKIGPSGQWAIDHWSPNPNKIYAYGVSMGGGGIGQWAIKQDNIPFVIAQRPVWWWDGDIPSQTNGGVADYSDDPVEGSSEDFGTWSNLAMWISQANCAQLPFIESAVGRTDVTLPNYDMWNNEMAVVAAIKACHGGFAFAWNDQGHGNEPDLLIQMSANDTNGKLFGFYMTAFTLNTSYPAFQDFSLDNNLTTDCTSGTTTCTINAGWHWSSVTDTTSQWSASITNPNITSTATATVTIRNAQNFVLVPGQQGTWTATGTQGGMITADSYGLLTIPSVTFSSGATVVTVTMVPRTGTMTSITSVPNPSIYGEAVTITASVSPAGPPAPTGTVSFTSNGVAIEGCSAVPLSSSLTAVCMTSALPVGTDALVASYSGDGNYQGSSSSATQIVNPVPVAVQFVPVAPCRVADTRKPNGPFGGPSIQGGTSRSFTIPQGACNITSSAAAYSLNVTVVPHGTLGYLTIWPTGEGRPYVSTMNSYDGRTKANAAIVPAGTSGAVSVYVSNTTDVVLDIDGYFAPATSGSLQFYPLTPCRVVDTRDSSKPQGLGPPFLPAETPRELPILSSPCFQGLPTQPQAYSFNVTVAPNPAGQPLYFLAVWPDGTLPTVSTLNNPTATAVANAAIVAADPTNGDIYVYGSNSTDVVMDVNGYFAAPEQGGLSLYPVVPCRLYDSRKVGNGQPFSGERTVNVVGSSCAPPSGSQAYVFNATVVPSGALGFLTLWPDCQGSGCPGRPVVSTLNAYDGAVTSNMAIVPNVNGSTDAYVSNPTQLILDISGYFAP